MARVRISDVAAAAGVSVTTVSHALSGKRPVAAETERKVRDAAERLSYRPSTVARSLRTRRSQTIALVVPDITNPFFPMVARGVQDAALHSGYQVVIASTDADGARELRFIEDLVARSIDGVILDLFRTPAHELGRFVEARIPVVMIGEMDGEGIGDRVVGDDRDSVAAATKHLLDAGRRRIAFVGGAPGAGPGDLRRSGYRDALAATGIIPDPALIVDTDYTRAGAYAAFRTLLQSGIEVDGVVGVNDLAAIGVLDAVREAGRRVPEEIAVIGYDDIEAARLVRPALSTVENRAYDKGVLCAELLLKRIAGDGDAPFERVVVPGRLVLRDSA
ncbi:MAG: LacI family DNA-binding transcriptional regulator [Protaetiibacter sp.]